MRILYTSEKRELVRSEFRVAGSELNAKRETRNAKQLFFWHQSLILTRVEDQPSGSVSGTRNIELCLNHRLTLTRSFVFM